jgi:hypothetical protein
MDGEGMKKATLAGFELERFAPVVVAVWLRVLIWYKNV